MKHLRLIIFFLITNILIKSTTAGIDEKIKNWFDQQNFTNITDPGIYEGQSARYMTLGGVSTRNPISSPITLLDVQTPKFSAGCAGIDYYGGGFRAINSDQFIENLRNIGQNAQSLAFMLAIQIVSPQLSGVMEDIQTWADKYLKLNMDSCQAATKLVGGTMDFFGAKASNCTIKRMQDFGEDWAIANHNCTTGGKIKQTENSNEEPNKVDFIKGNLSWSVLMQDSFFKNDTLFAEMIMNITGTIIISDSNSSDDSPSQLRIIDPAISNEIKKERFDNIFESILKGNRSTYPLMLYRCKDTDTSSKGCLKVSSQIESVQTDWEGLQFKVLNLIRRIIEKIHKDLPLDNEEKGLISSTSIPIYRLLIVTSAYFPSQMDITRSVNNYTRLIAEDILLRIFNGILSNVEQQTSMMPEGISQSTRIKEYRINVQKALNGIALAALKNTENINRLMEMQQRIQLYEKALMSRLSSGIISSALWGNN